MTMDDAQWSREKLLDLFESYLPRGLEQRQEITRGLPLSRRGGFRSPEKILIVLFASRAGSNFFGQLLSSTGWFREIQESFRPEQLVKIRDRHALPDLHEAAQWMIDNRGTPNAFGFKAGSRVLIAAAELGFLSEVIDRASFVLLRRRDRVAQAVSLVKSRITGRNHSRQPEARPLTDGDFDHDAIALEVANIKELEAQFSVVVDKLGKPAPVVYYEDICAAPTAHVAQVCNFLGLKMPSDFQPEVRLSILRDDLSARWIERFRAETDEPA